MNQRGRISNPPAWLIEVLRTVVKISSILSSCRREIVSNPYRKNPAADIYFIVDSCLSPDIHHLINDGGGARPRTIESVLPDLAPVCNVDGVNTKVAADVDDAVRVPGTEAPTTVENELADWSPLPQNSSWRRGTNQRRPSSPSGCSVVSE